MKVVNIELNKYYDFLIAEGIATMEEIDLVCNIIGYKEKTLDSILYARTGFRDLEQYKESN